MYHKCIFETVLNISYISSYARDLFAIARSIYVWTNIFDVWKYSETVWSKIFSFYSLVNSLKSQNKVIWMFFPHESLWISKFIIELRKKNNNRQWFLFRSSTFILRKIHLLYNISVKLMLTVICENLDMLATNDNLSSKERF